MNRKLSFLMSLCFVLLVTLGTSSQMEGQTSQTKSAVSPANQQPVVKTPSEFGIYYESGQGLSPLTAETTLTAANPTFVIYLKDLPSIEKLRLRFAKTSDYQSVVNLKYGEGAGVYEAKITPIQGRGDIYRATYSGTLKPGLYVAYYFTDKSVGEMHWEKASFEYAGQFTIR